MGTIANVIVEPCNVSWDSTDLGFLDGDLEIAPDEHAVDITAHQEGTNILDAIRTGKSAEVTLTIKETSVAQLNTLLGVGGGSTDDTAQVATLLCTADVSSSLHGDTFPLIARDGTQYLFQLKETATALVAPVIPGWTVVQITFTEDDTANAIADAVAAAIDALAGFAAPNPGAATITITWSDGGAVPSGSTAGNTGFTFTVTTAGASDLVGWGSTKDFTGQLAESKKLVLHPVTREATDYVADFAFWKAYPLLGSIVKSGENPQNVEVTFKVFPDTSKPAAVRLFAMGDHT